MTLTKIPSYPTYFWLPEAHVEATWTGSVMLASIVLKFSLFAVVMYLTTAIATATAPPVVGSGIISLTLAVSGMMVCADLKKVGAYLSIAHMNAGLLLLQSSDSCLTFSMDALWFAHSLTALLYFAALGGVYASSASRTPTALSADPHRAPLATGSLVALALLNVPLPLGPLAWSELVALAAIAIAPVALALMATATLAALPIVLALSLLRSVVATDSRLTCSDLPIQTLGWMMPVLA
jgi:NADH:ubiquinone oxidoreductase subunit 4 (subunit M)